MKKLNNLLLTGIGAAILAFSGCENLIKYNVRNAQIYKDFSEFVREKGQEIEDAYYISDKSVGTAFVKNELTTLFTNKRTYNDLHADGLDSIIERGLFTKIYSEKQLVISQEYTELIRKMMHNAKYKEY